MIESTAIFLDTYQKIDKAHRKYFQAKFAKYGFTPNELLVIMFLYNNAPELDTATDIARLKGVSKGMIARSVESLYENKYLDAVRDPNDRRVIHLSLKSQHHELAAEIGRIQKEFLHNLENGILESDMQITKHTLLKLLKNAENLCDGRENHGND